MILEKGGKKVYFDTKIPIDSSSLIAAKIKTIEEGTMVALEQKEMPKKNYTGC
jgi:hypothetical protein